MKQLDMSSLGILVCVAATTLGACYYPVDDIDPTDPNANRCTPSVGPPACPDCYQEHSIAPTVTTSHCSTVPPYEDAPGYNSCMEGAVTTRVQYRDGDCWEPSDTFGPGYPTQTTAYCDNAYAGYAVWHEKDGPDCYPRAIVSEDDTCPSE